MSSMKRSALLAVCLLVGLFWVVTSVLAQCNQPQTFTFGGNNYGQLGNGTVSTSIINPVSVDTSGVLNGLRISGIACGYHTLLLSKDGQVFGVGSNANGQLGIGSTTSPTLAPVAVDTSGVLSGLTITAVAAGEGHSLVLASTGQVYSFGNNGYGQLGIGNTTQQTSPVAVSTSDVLNGKTITAISGGNWFSLVLDSDGKVYSFGMNDRGQLGDASTTQRTSPVAVVSTGALNGLTVTAISAGYSHSIVLASNGRTYTFGRNNNGQLGIGNTTQQTSPVAVVTTGVLSGLTLVAIAAGDYHTLVLSSTGLVFSFGRNDDGQLGDNSTNQRTSPVAVSTADALNGKNISAVAARVFQSLVLSTTGQVFSFGQNNLGQLGDGSTTNRNVPVAVSTSGVLSGHFATGITAGFYYSGVIAVTLDSVAVGAPYLYLGQQDVQISWCGPGLVNIELIRDGDGTVDEIVLNWSGESPFIWTNVSVSDARRTDYRFQISSVTYPGVSALSEPFEIDSVAKSLNNVITPTTYLYRGQSDFNITWSSTGYLGDLKIELIRDGIGTTEEIVTNYPDGSPFVWASVTASDARRTDYRFRISSISYPYVSRTSNSTFEIDSQQKNITVDNPSQAFNYLYTGMTPNPQISWSVQGYVGNDVAIELWNGLSSELIVNTSSNPFNPWDVSAFAGPSTSYFVRVISVAYPNIFGDSALFEIDNTAKSITVTISDSNWSYHPLGVQMTISWTTTGVVGPNCDIQLCTSISCPDSLIATDVPFNQSSANWTLNGIQSRSDYFVRIVALESRYAFLNGNSTPSFEVDATKSISVVAPVTGSNYLTVGQTNVPLSWNITGSSIGVFKIELVRDSAPSFVINASLSTESPYTWGSVSAIESQQSLNYRIRVSSLTYTVPSVVFGESPMFEIETVPQKRINTSNPVTDGTYLFVGQSENPQINWGTEGYVGATVSIELRRQGNTTGFSQISSSVVATTSPFTTWTVSAFNGRQTDYFLRIQSEYYSSGSQIQIVESPQFEIDIARKTITVTAPVGSSVWEAGSGESITWTHTGFIGPNVRIVLIHVQSSVETQVVSSTSDTGSYSLTVPDIDTGFYTVKVISEMFAAVHGSSGSFRLINRARDYLVLVTPAGGALWTIGTSAVVEWLANGVNVGDNLAVQLKRDGISIANVTNSVAISNNQFTVDTTALGISTRSDKFTISITSVENPLFTDESSQFEIDFAKTLQVDSIVSSLPNPKYLVSGSTHDITWSGTGYLGNGNITLKRFDEESGTTIVTTIATAIQLTTPTGQFSWTVPTALPRDENYVIEFQSTSYSFVNGTMSPFEIDAVEKEIILEHLGVQYPDDDGFNVSAIWTIRGYVGNVSVSIVESSDVSVQVLLVDENVSPSEGYLEWTALWSSVSGVLAFNHAYRLRIASQAYSGNIQVFSEDFRLVGPPLPSSATIAESASSSPLYSGNSNTGGNSNTNDGGGGGGAPAGLVVLGVVGVAFVLLLIIIVVVVIVVVVAVILFLYFTKGQSGAIGKVGPAPTWKPVDATIYEQPNVDI